MKPLRLKWWNNTIVEFSNEDHANLFIMLFSNEDIVITSLYQRNLANLFRVYEEAGLYAKPNHHFIAYPYHLPGFVKVEKTQKFVKDYRSQNKCELLDFL